MRPKNIWKKALQVAGTIVGIGAACFLVLLLLLTVTEYNPEETEQLTVEGEESKALQIGDSLTIMTWNVGYASLGDYADFFMDGGTQVNTSTLEQVNDNLSAVITHIEQAAPDVVYLQEVDMDSKRSHYVDEKAQIQEALSGYQNTFASNYKVLYVPYPLPMIGKVDCGIMTLSQYEVASAERLSLPCPFTYPLRVCNLKRCLMVDRIAIQGSDKELVLVNLHLEAYDDGGGRAAQTQMLQELLQQEADKGNYVIAGGDFNQTFSSTDTSAYPLVNENLWEAGVISQEDFGDGWQFAMDSSVPSCRSLDQAYVGSDKENFQYYMIDGFLVSSNLTINEIQTEDLQFANSDHNPVVMNVTLQ